MRRSRPRLHEAPPLEIAKAAMRLEEFDYALPPELIAQEPLEDRPASRLMVVERASGRWEHVYFGDLPRYLDKSDIVVLNRSRVIPARLLVRRETGGEVELLATRIVDARRFNALASNLKKIKPGDALASADGELVCRVVERIEEREVLISLERPATVELALDSHGHVPLPPYIRRADKEADRERYQTVYAREPGSSAAPTAGLHFDEDLLEALEVQGVDTCSLVLHVGLGTFLPLHNDVVEKNRLHAERFTIDSGTVAHLTRAKKAGRRFVAVGTTTTRVLETLASQEVFTDPDTATDHAGETDLFIYPGYNFRFVDKIITNFHLPRSSLLLLVSAFLGREKTLACYEEAVRAKYRFYSYGDAMFIR